MSKKYALDPVTRQLHPVEVPDVKAPRARSAGLLGSPNQTVMQSPRPREYMTETGPQVDLFLRMRHKDTARIVPVKQNNYILRAPAVPVGPRRTDTIDRRLGIESYPERYRDEYPHGSFTAPASLQSIPGYVTVNGNVVTRTMGYPTGALKAPRAKVGGGQCNA
jgi:hypothetical protein